MPKRKKPLHKYAASERLGTIASSAPTFNVLAAAAIIVLASLLVYLPAINGGFIFDDDLLLTNNLLILTSDGLWKFWCSTEPTDYWPVSNTTLWIEWRLWGMNPLGYHVTNLILHIVESLLIWIILRKLAIPGAFLAALIFAVHPVNVESAAWIASRKNLMAMLFFLLSILSYLKFELPSSAARRILSQPNDTGRSPTQPNDTGRSPTQPADAGRSPIVHRILFYWLSLIAFVLAGLSKGSVVVLPFLLLGILWWRRPLTRWDLARILPFMIIFVVLMGVNVWFQTHGTGRVIRSAGFIERLLGAGGMIWFYLYKALLPIDLAFVYPRWRISAGYFFWWLSLLADVGLTTFLILAHWRYKAGWSRALLFTWGFFCVSLVPVLGFTDVGFMRFSLVADRYQHIAIIGVITLAAAGWGLWRLNTRGMTHFAATVVAVAAVGALAFLAWRQSNLYTGPTTLYPGILVKNPDCWFAHNNLGATLFQAGRPKEALEHYQQALRLNPKYPDARNNLGVCLKSMGQYQQALEQYEEAIRLKPAYSDAHYNLGIILGILDRPQEAIEHFREAVRLRPEFAEGYANLARAYAFTKQSTEALATAQIALDKARSQGQSALIKRVEDWLKEYRAILSAPQSAPSVPNSASPPP